MSITTATASPASAPRLLRAASCCSGAEGSRGRTFAEVPGAQPFFCENSNGLIEIAVREGGAGEVLGIGIGEPIGAA